jgi:hypothetical protein
MSIIDSGNYTILYKNYFLLLQQENNVPNPRVAPITTNISGIIIYTDVIKFIHLDLFYNLILLILLIYYVLKIKY